jgi:hypothetical protein
MPEPTCDQCGAPATHMVRDVRDTTPDGAQWKTYEPPGSCAAGVISTPCTRANSPARGTRSAD